MGKIQRKSYKLSKYIKRKCTYFFQKLSVYLESHIEFHKIKVALS